MATRTPGPGVMAYGTNSTITLRTTILSLHNNHIQQVGRAIAHLVVEPIMSTGEAEEKRVGPELERNVRMENGDCSSPVCGGQNIKGTYYGTWNPNRTRTEPKQFVCI